MSETIPIGVDVSTCGTSQLREALLVSPKGGVQNVVVALDAVPAARLLGVANGTVYALAVKGEIVTQQVAGRVVVSRESIDAYLERSK